MHIENSEKVIKIRKRFYIYTILVTLSIALILMSNFFEKPIFGFSKEFYVIVLIVVYLFYYGFRFWLDLNFIDVQLTSDKLIFKYFSLRPLNKLHKTIEIPLNSFLGFKIQSSAFGLKKKLYLYQKLQGKVAKYPSISLSSLDKHKYNQLVQLLSSISSK